MSPDDWHGRLEAQLFEFAGLLEDGEYAGRGRFADLADPLRDRIPDLVAGVREPPRLALCHRDYRLVSRLPALINIDLWMADASAAERDERAADHRAFVETYL